MPSGPPPVTIDDIADSTLDLAPCHSHRAAAIAQTKTGHGEAGE